MINQNNMEYPLIIKNSIVSTQSQVITDRFLEETFVNEYLEPYEESNGKILNTKEVFYLTKILSLRDFLEDMCLEKPENIKIQEYLRKVKALLVVGTNEKTFSDGRLLIRYVTFNWRIFQVTRVKYVPDKMSIIYLPKEILDYIAPNTYKKIEIVSASGEPLNDVVLCDKIFELRNYFLEVLKKNNYFQDEFMTLYEYTDEDLFFSPTSTGALVSHFNHFALSQFENILEQYIEQSPDNFLYKFVANNNDKTDTILDLEILTKYENMNAFLATLKQRELNKLFELYGIPLYELSNSFVLEIVKEKNERETRGEELTTEKKKLKKQLSSNKDYTEKEKFQMIGRIAQITAELDKMPGSTYFSENIENKLKNLSLKFLKDLRSRILEDDRSFESLAALIKTKIAKPSTKSESE